MGLVSKTYTFASGAIILASEHNTNFDTLFTLVNGQIDNTNLSATAAIADSKLAQIATAGKVSGAALTSLTSVPVAAGIIPIANLPKGNSANQLISCGTNGVLPALDGSLLTNVPAGTITDAALGTGSASASNFLRGDRTWAGISTGALITSAYTSNTTGTSFTSTLTTNVVGLSKTITSGNTVYIHACGFCSGNNATPNRNAFILYAGATSIQTVYTYTTTSGAGTLEGWSLSGIVTGLSGATTFKVTPEQNTGNASVAWGNLTVLEF